MAVAVAARGRPSLRGDASWVNRRLQLLCGLRDAALAAVRRRPAVELGAVRVVAPLARANAAHADRLLQALADAPLSTRALRDWFMHYQQASHATRDRLVGHRIATTSNIMPNIIKTEIRNSVRVLQAQGQTLREISACSSCRASADPA